MTKRKQLIIAVLCSLLFIGAKITNAQTTGMRLMETIEIDSISQEASCVYYNGDMIIVGKSDGTLELWNYKKKEIIKTFKGHTSEITAGTLNNAGTYIASAAKDNTIKLWRIKSGEEVYSFNRYDSIIVLISTLIFNDELNILISVDEYNNINTWNTNGIMYGKDAKKSTFKKFCSVVPGGWECEIITNGFNKNDITQGADTNPIAVIKYLNPNKEFTHYRNGKINPSLILNLYSINLKQELINYVKLYHGCCSWCIPVYYGETKDYFIITSQCFINGGTFTDEANSCINDLHKALKRIITINDVFNNNQTNDAYEYFKNAELQCEESQRESIITALNDILNLSVEELKNKRYPNYTGEENQWNLPTLIYKHFVPAEQKTFLGINFYNEIKRKEVQKQIEEILAEIQSDEQDYEITVGNNIKFDVGNDDTGKQEKLVIFTLVVTNLSDTIPVSVLSNENVFKHATFFINNKEVTNPATPGGLERTREKDMLLKGEGDYFSWSTSVDYLKNEYGNIFTVQWKYLNIYSNISKVNLEDEAIERH